jgi:hypothetical protein
MGCAYPILVNWLLSSSLAIAAAAARKFRPAMMATVFINAETVTPDVKSTKMHTNATAHMEAFGLIGA